ncbi:MAG: SHOCT domain-containing protein [Rhodoglobus sp.]
MMWDYNGMGGWAWAWVFGSLAIIGVVILVVVLIRVLASPRQPPPAPREDITASPRRILDERYARGELTTEEYRERLSALGLDT